MKNPHSGGKKWKLVWEKVGRNGGRKWGNIYTKTCEGDYPHHRTRMTYCHNLKN